MGRGRGDAGRRLRHVARARDDRPQFRRLLARCVRARYATPYPGRRAARPVACGLRRDRRTRRSRAETRRPRIARLARGRRDSLRRGDIDPPRPRAREARAHGALCRASTRLSAATRSRSESPRRISTSRLRDGSARERRPRAWCSRIPEPGVRAALAAGMTPIMVPRSHSAVRGSASRSISSCCPRLHDVLSTPRRALPAHELRVATRACDNRPNGLHRP